MLIGANVPDVLIQLEVKQPMTVRTPLGWTLFGCSNKTKRHESYSKNMVHVQNDHNCVTKIIKGFWGTEEGWNSNERETGISQVDKKCL